MDSSAPSAGLCSRWLVSFTSSKTETPKHMTRTYDLRNRWSATITAFCQYTNADLNRFNFTSDALTKFVGFVQANGYVFTDADLRLWCAEVGYNYAPFIRQWMGRVSPFRVVTPVWGDPEAISIAIL